MNFEINKINSFQILDNDTLEPIIKYDYDDIFITMESEIETSSLSKEKLSFNHEVTLEAEMTDFSPLMTYVADFNDVPLYIEYYIPIMIQARWHKKPRINKKWLKRYGMKEDTLLVRCDVESISPNIDYDSYRLTEHMECGITLKNIQYKFRPDQLRKNLKIEFKHSY